jgi:hypothetical protein
MSIMMLSRAAIVAALIEKREGILIVETGRLS